MCLHVSMLDCSLWVSNRTWEDSVRTSRGAGRDLAATAQHVFEKIVLAVFETALAAASFEVQSIVMTGGCALNVIALPSAWHLPWECNAAFLQPWPWLGQLTFISTVLLGSGSSE